MAVWLKSAAVLPAQKAHAVTRGIKPLAITITVIMVIIIMMIMIMIMTMIIIMIIVMMLIIMITRLWGSLRCA